MAETNTVGPTSLDLPDGRTVECVFALETEGLWNEIAQSRLYADAVAGLGPDEVIVDVGAHIGLASMLFADRVPGARILAFEPAPRSFACLELNFARHVPDGTAVNVAIGAERGVQQLTYYPYASTMSTLYVDAADERRNTEAVLDHFQMDERVRAESARLRQVTEHTDVEVTTLSAALAEHGAPRVGLLKVDVERAEIEVLRGIEPDQWHGIRRLVLEVHDIDGRLDATVELLTGHGYHVRTEQEEHFAGGSVHGVLATRSGLGATTCP
jgi:31-O-methyltransferase